jgi:3D (Asp-Asp-Asp) domain-containing protein
MQNRRIRYDLLLISFLILAIAFLFVIIEKLTTEYQILKVQVKDVMYQHEIKSGALYQRVDFLESLCQRAFGEIPETMYSIPVTVTAYSARPQETDSEPWRTADLTLSRVGLLAVSRDLMDEIGLRFGDTVILENLGVFKVRDVMNSRWTRRVDILMANYEAAVKFSPKQSTLYWF